MNVVIAGVGAFGKKHLDGIRNIEGVECVSVVGRKLAPTQTAANHYNIPHACTDLSEALELPEVDAVILATPTQLHASQAIQCLNAGKHVQVEIPLAESLAEAEAVVAKQKETGLVAMCGHTRRFNPSHQWVHNKIKAGELNVQQMDVQTYFFRRENINAMGEPRSWTDHLLWHHAAHTVDLFAYQTGEKIVQVSGMEGPLHPKLGIAMDMSIQLKTQSGKICTLSLSFNNDGPIGTFFRYICDNGTYIARYDDLVDGHENPIDVSDIDVSMNGIELQDREFFSAIKEEREPNSSVAQVLDCYRVLHEIEQQIGDIAMITSSTVTTQHGVAYMRRLCKHFAHKIPTSMEGNCGRIEFPFGVCTIECDENHMFIRVVLEDAVEADRAERVVGEHLIRMANKDEPVVCWERGANQSVTGAA